MLLLVVLSFSLLESIMLDNAVVAVWSWFGWAFPVHSLPKTQIGTDFYGNTVFFCLTNNHGVNKDHQEDTAIAAAIAAAAVASKANAGAEARADAGANTRAIDGSDAAIAGAVSLADTNAEAVDAAIFDFAESIELDDKDVAKEVGEVGDGNVNVSRDISDDDDRRDGDGDGNGGVLPM